MPSPINIEEVMNSIKNLNETTISAILVFMMIIIILIVVVYYLYMTNLQSSECGFMDRIYSKLNGNLKSINSDPHDPQCKYTLKDYYIKTAYNCCSGGSYKNDFVDTCVLKDMIRQGVRGLDFEIYSIEDQPVVATSTVDNYYVKETYNSIKFADVMSIIKQYAFSSGTSPNSNDPLILYLRIKSSNQKMYENFATLLKLYDYMLLGPEYSYDNYGHNLGDVELLTLVNKVIIVVDRLNLSFLECEHFVEYVNMTSNSIFMRGLHYYDIHNSPDLMELVEFNRKNMTIAMPDIGIDPPNISGILVREAGCQMIAMRYQLVDVNLEENIRFFDLANYAFALKPEKLRYIPVTIPIPEKQNPAYSYAIRTVKSDYYGFDI